MAAIFSPAAEPGPSPPSAKSAASAAEAAYMERAAKQLKEEAKRERSESAASALGEQAQTVWAKLNANGPVTAEVFVQWYSSAMKPIGPAKKTSKKKRAAASTTAAPDLKRQALLPGAAPILGKSKRNALLKALTTALKAAAGSKKTKWHEGDSDKLTASTVVDGDDLLALLPGVAMNKKGVTTSFSMTSAQITEAFGDVKLKVATWSRSRRAFQKAYQTGSKPVSLLSAEGKYSSNTSTLTMKFNVRVAGGSNGHYGGFGWGLAYGDDY